MRRPGAAAAGFLLGSLLGPAWAVEWVAPASERTRVNPLAPAPEALAKGRALYQRHCARCHGDRGRGDGPAASQSVEEPKDLTSPDLQQRLTDGEILYKITQGRKEGEEIIMPAALDKVPAETDRWKLVLFVRSLVTRAGR